MKQSTRTERDRLNRQAQAGLVCEKFVNIVPGAGQHFEEPGTLDGVVALARS